MPVDMMPESIDYEKLAEKVCAKMIDKMMIEFAKPQGVFMKAIAGVLAARRGDDSHLQKEFWKRLAVRGADFVGIVDHGLDFNSKIKKGQYHPQYSSGRALKYAEKWGRYGMQWAVAKGLRGARGSKQDTNLEGGTLIAPSAQWRGAAQEHFTDPRGWGRFAGTVVKGAKGWKSQIVITTIYCPTPSGASWKRQEASLSSIRATTCGIEANPRAQCYRDLYESLSKFRNSKTMRTAFVVMGDFNEPFEQDHQIESLFSGIVGFARLLQLEDAMTFKHGGDQHQRKFWTRTEGGRFSTPDHILISKQLLSLGALEKVGVWQHNSNFRSDHRMLGAELRCERWLGCDARRQRLQRPKFKVRDPILYLNDDAKVLEYQRRIAEQFTKDEFQTKILKVEQAVADRQNAGIPYGHDDPNLQLLMDELDHSFFNMLLQTKNAIAGRKTLEGTKQRSPFKGPASAEQKLIGKEIREIDSILGLAKINRGSAAARARRFVEKHNATWLGDCNIIGWRQSQWGRWTQRLTNRRKVLKKKFNAAWREEKRDNRQKNRAWIKKAFEEKKQRALIARMRGKRPETIDRDCLTVGKGDDQVCLDTKDEIGLTLRDHFAQWFREGVDSWFQQWENGKVIYTHPLFVNDMEGMKMRQKVVDGLSGEDPDSDTEFQQWLHTKVLPGIPEHIHWVLKLYGRKYSKVIGRRVEQHDYTKRGVMCTITEEKHEQYWIKKSANKASDFRGINANLIKALRKTVKWQGDDGKERQGVLTWQAFETVRFMLNTVVRTGMIYTTWQDEVLLTVPKVQGSSLLNDIRPIGLLPLLRNAFFGIQYSMVKDTWQQLALVSTTQYGAQRGVGTAQFRMMEMCIFEHCYIYKKPITKGNEDKRKAYDRPSATVGYQMGLMRMAMCHKLLMVDAKAGKTGRVHVRFAYGFAPAFQKCGFGSCGFSATQGSEDGPDKYGAFEDPLNTWWEEEDMGVWIEASEHKRIQLKGGGFVDDKAPMGLLGEVCKWYTKSSLFCLFHGAEPNPPKCSAHVKDYVPNSDRLLKAVNFKPPTMIIAGQDDPISINLVEADKSLKTLGQLINPALYWKEQMTAISILAEETALVLSGGIDRRMSKMYWSTCFERSFLYKALFVETTEEKMYTATRSAWGAYKRGLGLARSSPTKACFAFGIGDLWVQLMIERFMVLVQALNSGRQDVIEVAQAMLFLEQKWEGSATHCLERRHCAQRGRSGTWAGDLRAFMSTYDISVIGGEGLGPLREHDANVVDAASHNTGFVSAGLWCIEVWRLSEFFTSTGERRIQWLNGEWQQKIRDEIGYTNEEIKEEAANNCIMHIENMLKAVEGNGVGLGGFLRQAVRVGSLAIIPPSDADPLSSYYLVLVISMQVVQSWEDEVVIEILQSGWPEVDGVELEDHHMAKAIGDVCDRGWETARGCQLWTRYEDAAAKKEATMAVPASMLLPIATKPFQHTCNNGVELQGWMIDEREELILDWINRCNSHVDCGWDLTQVNEATGEEVWEFEGRDELVGFQDFGAAALSWSKHLAELSVAGVDTDSLTLQIYSDGSYINKGETPKASYGWIIWGFENHFKMDGVEGGGMVHGDPARLNSTRAEHHGALAVLMAAYLLGWRGKVQLRLDNSGVTHRMENVSDKGSQWSDEDIVESPVEWLQMKDPDVYAESMAWAQKFTEVEWIWYRGHPEKRKHYSQYNQHDWASVGCDRIAGQQYRLWGDAMINPQWWDFPHAPQWKVYCGEERLEGPLRKELTHRIQERRVMEYMAENAAKKLVELDLLEGNQPDPEWANLPDDVHADGAQQLTRTRMLSIKKHQVIAQLKSEWFLPGLMRDMLCKTTGEAEQVLGIKILSGILATEASAAHRGAGGEAWPCRLCGQAVDGGETNFHVLWRCTHNEKVVECRQTMIGEVWEILQELDMIDEQGVVAAAILAVQDGKTLWNEVSGMMEVITGAGANWEQQKVFQTAAETMNGKAIDWARRGASGLNWVKALTHLGVPHEKAAKAIRQLNLCLRKGSANVWKQFIHTVHNGDETIERLNQADVANDMIREIFEDEENPNLVLLGKSVMTFTLHRKKKWLVQFMELEPQVGRSRAMTMAKASSAKAEVREKQTMRGQWKEVKEAARRKRRKKGDGDDINTPQPTSVYAMMMDVDVRRHQQEQGVLTLKGVKGVTVEKKKALSKRSRDGTREQDQATGAHSDSTGHRVNLQSEESHHKNSKRPTSHRSGINSLQRSNDGPPLQDPNQGAERASESGDEDALQEAGVGAWRGSSRQGEITSELQCYSQPGEGDEGHPASAVTVSRHCMGMGGGGAGARAPATPMQEGERAGSRCAGALAAGGNAQDRVERGHTKRDLQGRVKAARTAEQGREGAQEAGAQGEGGETNANLPAGKKHKKGKRRPIRIDSDSDTGCVAVSEEWSEGQGREGYLLGSCWSSQADGQGDRGSEDKSERCQAPAGNLQDQGTQAPMAVTRDGASCPEPRSAGLFGHRGCDPELKGGGHKGGALLCGSGHQEAGFRPYHPNYEGELAVGLHQGNATAGVGHCGAQGEAGDRVGRQDNGSNNLDITTMCNFLNCPDVQQPEEVQLQSTLDSLQTPNPRQGQVHSHGCGSGQIGQEGAGGDPMVCGAPWSSLGSGEPSGLSGMQALHETPNTNTSPLHSGLLRFQREVYEEDSHLEQYSVEAIRDNRRWEVQQQVPGGQGGREGQMGAQLCAGKGELEGSSGEGQGRNESRSATATAQGDDTEEALQNVKHGKKRDRELPTRVGHRRQRENEIDSAEDDETNELVRRGAASIDCKRNCADSSIS